MSWHAPLVWIVVFVATAGVIVRPFRWPEFVWACGGAVVLVATRLVPAHAALGAIGRGTDVYFFLTGMMLLSETARREGLFDWVASAAVAGARGSPRRLFLLVYAVGTVVTTFLSNDATAVVLTPAVYAAAKKAKLEALPFLFVCAFVANAASFVLPISNPANIVLYGDHTPALGTWLERFALASLLAIVATYAALALVEMRALGERFEGDGGAAPLEADGKTALGGIVATAVVLLVVSARDVSLGIPTCAMGVATSAVVWIRKRESPLPTLAGVSWAVLPLVAGLFVLVEALVSTGAIAMLARAVAHAETVAATITPWALGAAIAVACNLTNNLPAGLVASSTIGAAHLSQRSVDALLVGVDLGPNFSVTGSLATILWLTVIRREGEDVGFWRFLRVGMRVTPLALALSLAGRLLLPIR